MRDDRELLELAAKAAGLTGECHLLTGDCSDPNEPGGFRYEHPDGGHDWWNPLMDDGDALRLAVKLHMQVSITTESCRAETLPALGVRVNDKDEMAAARRAIVLAAAAIGESMK